MGPERLGSTVSSGTVYKKKDRSYRGWLQKPLLCFCYLLSYAILYRAADYRK